jgi:drug/metabolite transporter (DMT)-like permease
MTHYASKKDFYSGIGLALITTLIWSVNYVIARGISGQLPPVALAFYRWGLAALCLLPFGIKELRKEQAQVLSHKSYFFWTALTGVTIFNTLIYVAGHYTQAINLALIGTTSAPVFATILAVVFLQERIGWLRVTGMLVCIAGILYLLSGGEISRLAGFQPGKGEALILLSAFSFAIYNTLVRKKPSGISPMVFLTVVFTLGTLLLAPFYLYELLHSPAVNWHPSMLLAIAYLGIGNSIIAFFCWNASIAKLGASGTALFANLIPVFSTAEAILFLDEKFTGVHTISGLLIISGLVVANLRKPAWKDRQFRAAPTEKGAPVPQELEETA